MAKSKNYESKDIRTKDGNLRFGHIHNDEVKSSVLIQGQGGLEYISIDQTKPRNAWMTSRCRGRYQVKSGDNIPKGQPAMYFDASNGDIVIRTGGRILMQAENIHLDAKGYDNENGVISLKSNQEILLEGKRININGSESCSHFTSGEMQVTAANILKLYGGSIERLTATSPDYLKGDISFPSSSNVPFISSLLGF
jgi:hypothetical protein